MKYIFLFSILFLPLSGAFSQFNENSPVMVGAEILIEPGQSPEDVEHWFRLLKENGFKITRLRMFEDYMKDEYGNWDFSLFDRAFKAGDKYGIKILGNLFPATSFDDIGGFKFPRDEKHWNEIREYIAKTVTHFKDYESLFGWVPVNEPGAPLPWNQSYTKNKFEEWKAITPLPATTNGIRHFTFDREKFTLFYHPWFLRIMTEEIQKYDTEHAIHLNPAEIFLQAEMYEFADWRKFLTSLGGSAHAGWHFSYFIREQFAMAMSAKADFLRSGAKNLPWFMTEIQGGNNTYSAHTPMCPTAEEIAQWLWIVIGSGSKGALFWCLNPRSSGVEAGEWAMLDFQNNPSDRFITAAKIAQLVNDNEKLFSSTKYVNPNINVLYVKESMWVEEKLSRYISDKQNDARQKGGVIKSALGYFEALSQHGYNLNFGDINDFDFDAEDYLNHIVILSHQISIPSKHWSNLDNFVKRGGTLIVDGLTGFYNENAVCLMNNDFPLKNLFGGEVSEFKHVDKLFDLDVSGQKLKTHLWQGTIIPHTGTVISRNNNQPTGIINNYGKGKVFWIPSPLGLGAKISKEYEPLLSIFEQEFDNTGAFRFKKFHEGVLMKNIETSQGVISVLINKNKEKQTIELIGFEKYKPHRMLFQDKGGEIVSQNKVYIYPEETIVIDWRKK